jgi:hypothetical protein
MVDSVDGVSDSGTVFRDRLAASGGSTRSGVVYHSSSTLEKMNEYSRISGLVKSFKPKIDTNA